MSASPCMECGRRPKLQGRHRCLVCYTRTLPIGDQVAESRRRLNMVPPALRVKRSAKLLTKAPAGTTWCAGCQSWRDLADMKGATQCWACRSAKAHATRTEKVYGLTAAGYDELLKLQGGRCAICRQKPKSKRLAVDHDHATGAVRGLLCSRCNHDLLGNAWDSKSIALALWHYLNTSPATGDWIRPELGLAEPGQNPPSKGLGASDDLLGGPGGKRGPGVARALPSMGSVPVDYSKPIGAIRDKDRNLWRVFVGPGDPPPF